MRKTKQELIRDLREDALELSRKGEHRAALERFAELERLDPNEPDWPRRVADCHRGLSQTERQIAALGRAAELYGRAGALAKAIAVCKMILAVEPGHTETQGRLAALQTQGSAASPPLRARVPPPRLPMPTGPAPVGPAPVGPAPAKPSEARPDLGQLLRQRRVAQTKITHPASAAPADSPMPTAAVAPPAPPSAPPVSIALPFLPEGSLNEMVPGSQPIPSRRGIPSGMYRIEVGDVRAPESAGRAQRTAQKALPVTPLFSELGPASLERLIAAARLVHHEAGGVVYRQGDAAEGLLVIVSGAVALVQQTEERVELARFSEGEFFGEGALISSEPRQGTAEALESTDLLAIDCSTIRELIALEPSVLPTVLRFLRERLIESSMLTNPLFTLLSRIERRRLAACFDFIEIDPGSLAVWQGVRSPGLFVLLSGAVEVVCETGTEERVLASLGSGAVFGEMSLLENATAVADVRCLTRSFALLLPKADFQRVVTAYPPVLEFIQLLAEARRRENEAVLGAPAAAPEV